LSGLDTVETPADQERTGRLERNTRSRRRELDRQRAKWHSAVMRQGLEADESPTSLYALTHLLNSILAKRTARNRASKAAETLHGVFEVSFSKQPNLGAIACRKGCDYCCHLYVSALAPEIFLICRRIKALPPAERDAVVERINDTNSIAKGLSVKQRSAANLACALLVDGACSQYAVRPLSCRSFTSTSATACRISYESSGFQDDVPMLPAPMIYRKQATIAMLAALDNNNLDDNSYELVEALNTVLGTEAAEEKWLRGEDVFDPVMAKIRPPEELDALVADAKYRALG
jgi:Fe-S-cluster containining protein